MKEKALQLKKISSLNNYIKKSLYICLIVVLLSGCSLFVKEESEANAAFITDKSTQSQVTKQTDIPPELLEWVANSGWDISPELIAQHSLPVAELVAIDYPDSYLIETEYHQYERQQGNSCGGYASAYLLRTLGKAVSGQEAYDDMGYKITAGLVLPQGILDYLTNAGYPATLYQGSLEQLKTCLSSRSNPIVVLIGSSMEYQHYIALLGYDEDSLYFFDSNQPENPEAVYNVVLTNEEFASLWENIIPGFERIYIA